MRKCVAVFAACFAISTSVHAENTRPREVPEDQAKSIWSAVLSTVTAWLFCAFGQWLTRALPNSGLLPKLFPSSNGSNSALVDIAVGLVQDVGQSISNSAANRGTNNPGANWFGNTGKLAPA